jgi:hypothetical protein
MQYSFVMYSILKNIICVPYLSIIAWQITYVLAQNRITHIHRAVLQNGLFHWSHICQSSYTDNLETLSSQVKNLSTIIITISSSNRQLLIVKYNTICVGHHNKQASTNNVNKLWALLQTTGVRIEQNVVFMRKSQRTKICNILL